jgi:hypothetical protein
MLSFEEPPHETADRASAVAEAVTSTGVETVWLARTDGPEVTGGEADPRFGGVFVAPRETVLGIRLWRDVHEAVESDGAGPVSWSIYEIEKIVRMMLHQSPMALEILASPAFVGSFKSEAFEPRRIVEAAVTSEILQAYAQEAEGFLESADARSSNPAALGGLRRALMGEALAKGAVLTRLNSLLEWYASGELSDAVEADETPAILRHGRSILDDLRSETSPTLPEAPSDYDGLDALVVERRMAVSRGGNPQPQGGQS